MKKNPNRGTPRGRKAIRASVATYGAGRSIVVDRDGEIIAGHHTAEAAEAAGLPRKLVDTTGTELVVVQWTDLTAGDPRATGLALADNRTGDLNRRWDPRQVTSDGALLDASAVRMFAPVEMADFAAELAKPAASADLEDDAHTVRLTFETPDQAARWAAWLARLAALFPEKTTHEGRIAHALDSSALAG